MIKQRVNRLTVHCRSALMEQSTWSSQSVFCMGVKIGLSE